MGNAFTSDLTAVRAKRWRAIIKTVGAGVAARGVTTIVTLATVPLMLGYLGEERYAIWAMVMSLLALVNFADFGLSNSLVTLASAAYGRGDTERIRALTANALALLVFSATLVIVIFFTAHELVPWGKVFNTSSPQLVADAKNAVGVLIFGTAVALPLGLVYRLQLAVHQGASSHSWQAAASVLALAGLAVGTSIGNSLPMLVALSISASALVALVNFCLFFGMKRREFAPSGRDLSYEFFYQLARPGGAFLFLQIVSALSFSLDPFIIAHLIGHAEVVEYSVVQRMFGLVPLLLSLVLVPMWPAYGEAMASGDSEWARKAFLRVLFLTFLVGALATMTVCGLAGPILKFWIGDAIAPSQSFLLAYAAWNLCLCLGLAISNAMNGLLRLRFQLWAAGAFLITGTALKIAGAANFGLSGLVLGATVAYLVTFLAPFLWSGQTDRMFELSSAATPRNS